MTNKIIIRDRTYIPKELMSQKAIASRYEIQLFDESACAKCDNAPDRPNAMCEDCPAFVGDYQLWKETDTHWTVPQGDTDALVKVLTKKGRQFKVIDKRPDVPFEHPLEWTGRLFGKDYVDANGIPRANQKRVVKEWLQFKNGILCAPPRSGKTAMSVYLSMKLGQKTIVFAHQYELLKEFERTFREMTNLNELEKQTRKGILLFVNTIADLKKADRYDIIIVPYQKFIYDQSRITKYLTKKFGLLVVDECHNSGAVSYLRIVSQMNIKHRLSLSATPKRKDKRHTLIERIQGRVVAVAEATSLIPLVMFFKSKAVPPRPYKLWQHAKRWLTLSKERNLEIAKQVFKDLNAGHEVILIPIDGLAHQALLVELVNKMAKFRRKKYGEKWPKELAVAFNGRGGVQSDERKRVLKLIDAPGPTVVFAIRKLIREGVNLMRPSMMYIVEPMSAKDRDIGAPMFYQMSMRICTPYKKPQPVARIWIDNVGMFQSCVRGLFWNEIFPNRYTGQEGRYRVEENAISIVKGMSVEKTAGRKLKNNRGWV